MTQETINKVFHSTNYFTTMGLSGEKGSGLGIQLSLSYISKLNGEIAVQSEPNKGTTIQLKFPKVF